MESSWGFHGWRVVLAAHFGVMVSFGSLLVFTFGIFLKPLAAEFGWGRESISRAFAIGAMTVAVVSPFLGRLLDRYGSRRIVVPCMLVFGAAFASLSMLTPSLWHFYAVFVVLGAVGNGTASLGYMGAVSSWFTLRRGLALSVVTAGVGIGSIVLPILSQWLVDYTGWRVAYAALGGLIFLLGVPLTVKYVRNRAVDVVADAPVAAAGSSTRQAIGSRVFWVLAGSLCITSVSANGALTHMAPMLSDRGLTTADAALAAAALGGASLAGRLCTGWLLDRYFGPRVAMVLVVVLTSGIIMLAQASTIAAGIASAALIGFGMGGESDVTPFLLSRYFGLRSFSTLYGLTWTFYAIAGGLGPILMGRAFDVAGSYTPFMLMLAIPTMLSALLFLLMPPYAHAGASAAS